MLEFLLFLGALFLLGAVVIGLFKLLFALLVLPFKLGLWIFKGVFGLLLIIPALILSVAAASVVLPLTVAFIAVPLAAVAFGVVCLLKWIF